MKNPDGMKNLSSDMSMAQISMPGTHESAALYGWMNLGKCQDLSIKEQLEIGVRYLDIRCKLIKEKGILTLYHGMIDQKMTFDEVLVICNSFLQTNPSETIVMKIKEENGPNSGSINFAEIVTQHFDKYDPNLFYRQRDPNLVIPKLRDTRGKILVLKKFDDPMYYVPVGITVKGGEDNFTETINLSSKEQMVVQNTYKIWNNEQKAQLFKATLEESFSNPTQTSIWYINPTSGFHPATSNIRSIAAYMGSLVVKILEDKGKGNAGYYSYGFY